MQAKIRAAKPADLGALIDLENRSFSSDRLSRSSLRRLIVSPAADVIVAATGTAAAGYAVLLHRAGSRIARLYSLAVDPEFRGLGRELLAAAERRAAQRGCRALRLEVRDDNIRAINLYQRSAYRRFGQKPGYYADGATALRFEKSLPAVSPVDAPIARLAGTAAA
jgi:ribosomal-protein-alanine N-acetyltransferase